jgi:hypothetical protein
MCYLDKLRLLYEREQATARLVVQSKDDLGAPLVRALI